MDRDGVTSCNSPSNGFPTVAFRCGEEGEHGPKSAATHLAMRSPEFPNEPLLIAPLCPVAAVA